MITKVDCFIGIDPGANGGISVIIPGLSARAQKMPKTTEELRDMLQYYADSLHPFVVLEKLSIRSNDMTDNPGKVYRIQKMIANFTQIKTMLEALEIPFVMAHPMTWQSRLGIRIQGEAKQERKKRYKEIAAETYPQVRKVTLWNADAILLAHFGRKMLSEQPNWVLGNLPEKMIAKL